MAKGRLRARFFGVIGATLVLGAVGVGTVLAADHAVAIAGSAFSPATVTVIVGDTVTWTNNDQISHTATADGGAFDTGTLGNGDSNTVTFATAGTFAYHCTVHPTMTGTIVVEAAAAEPTAAPTNPPTDAVALGQSTAARPALIGAALVIGGAGFVGLLIARRRFAQRD